MKQKTLYFFSLLFFDFVYLLFYYHQGKREKDICLFFSFVLLIYSFDNFTSY